MIFYFFYFLLLLGGNLAALIVLVFLSAPTTNLLVCGRSQIPAYSGILNIHPSSHPDLNPATTWD